MIENGVDGLSRLHEFRAAARMRRQLWDKWGKPALDWWTSRKLQLLDMFRLCERRRRGHCGGCHYSISEGEVPVGGAASHADCTCADEDASRGGQRNHGGNTVDGAAVLCMENADEGSLSGCAHGAEP